MMKMVTGSNPFWPSRDSRVNSLCQPNSKWVTFSNQEGQGSERRGMDRLSNAVPRIQWTSKHSPHTATGLWKNFYLLQKTKWRHIFV